MLFVTFCQNWLLHTWSRIIAQKTSSNSHRLRKPSKGPAHPKSLGEVKLALIATCAWKQHYSVLAPADRASCASEHLNIPCTSLILREISSGLKKKSRIIFHFVIWVEKNQKNFIRPRGPTHYKRYPLVLFDCQNNDIRWFEGKWIELQKKKSYWVR